MNCSTLLRLLILFPFLLLLSPVFSTPTHQQQKPLTSGPSVNSLIASLKSSLSTRMDLHQSRVSTHLTGILTSLTSIGDSMDNWIGETDTLSEFVEGLVDRGMGTKGKGLKSDTELRLAIKKLGMEFMKVKGGSEEVLNKIDMVRGHLGKLNKEMGDMDGFLKRFREQMSVIRGFMEGKIREFDGGDDFVHDTRTKVTSKSTSSK